MKSWKGFQPCFLVCCWTKTHFQRFLTDRKLTVRHRNPKKEQKLWESLWQTAVWLFQPLNCFSDSSQKTMSSFHSVVNQWLKTVNDSCRSNSSCCSSAWHHRRFTRGFIQEPLTWNYIPVSAALQSKNLHFTPSWFILESVTLRLLWEKVWCQSFGWEAKV